MPDREVDAALSTLTEAQIQLSLEFNKPARIIKTVKTFPGHRKTVEPTANVVRLTKENMHQPSPVPRIHTPSHAMPGNPPRPVVTSTRECPCASGGTNRRTCSCQTAYKIKI